MKLLLLAVCVSVCACLSQAQTSSVSRPLVDKSYPTEEESRREYERNVATQKSTDLNRSRRERRPYLPRPTFRTSVEAFITPIHSDKFSVMGQQEGIREKRAERPPHRPRPTPRPNHHRGGSVV